MEIEGLQYVLAELVEFWKNQNILICPKSKPEVNQFPSDFTEFYSKVNGMEMFYPNETDNNGFLFYPIETVIPINDVFKDSELINKEHIYLFADYMHKSWWYGFEMINNEDYVIGIVADKDSFKPITHSLADFIKLYIDDSPKLYDYSSFKGI